LAQIVGLEPEALAKMEFAESSGCQQCRASGNNDQMPLYDVLFPDAQLRQSLSKARFNQQSVEMIEEAMHLNALEDAWLKAGSQLISPWEIIHKFG
jgi:type II secretory ATPase GspE/PulE/Tfp pilus assembly ATPase PilB-like protein